VAGTGRTGQWTHAEEDEEEGGRASWGHAEGSRPRGAHGERAWEAWANINIH
jgi:hypothetical protein